MCSECWRARRSQSLLLCVRRRRWPIPFCGACVDWQWWKLRPIAPANHNNSLFISDDSHGEELLPSRPRKTGTECRGGGDRQSLAAADLRRTKLLPPCMIRDAPTGGITWKPLNFLTTPHTITFTSYNPVDGRKCASYLTHASPSQATSFRRCLSGHTHTRTNRLSQSAALLRAVRISAVWLSRPKPWLTRPSSIVHHPAIIIAPPQARCRAAGSPIMPAPGCNTALAPASGRSQFQIRPAPMMRRGRRADRRIWPRASC